VLNDAKKGRQKRRPFFSQSVWLSPKLVLSAVDDEEFHQLFEKKQQQQQYE
jgi:hypothetical protein